MKYCEEYAALLDLFVDGELAPREMEQVRNHLAECPGCRAYVDDALAIRAGFPDVEDTVVPEGFAESVMERIRRPSAGDKKTAGPQRRGFRRWMGTAAALAACCALVVLVRTGPAGGNRAAVTAGGDCGGTTLYNNEDRAAADTAEDEAEGIAPQMAPEPAMAAEAAKEGEVQPTARAAGIGGGDDQAPASCPEAAPEDRSADDAALKESAVLYLTVEEAGDLLNNFTPAWENGKERRYELNAGEYRTLLEALGRQEELPETAEGPFLVAVTGVQE